MWRKALLAAVCLCLCLRWAAARGGESGTGERAGTRSAHGARLLLLGEGSAGGSAAGVAGKGSLQSFLCEAIPGCLGCCGTRESQGGLAGAGERHWGKLRAVGRDPEPVPSPRPGSTCRAGGATCG